ncbi:MAG TPA: sigma 54-interacting transcriptional regulator, partial [Polyangiaceae bacterium]
HERGSFTGAASTRPGRFELAEGGTLFLDEIGELPLEAQAKLLRVLEERQYERVGGTRTLRATARIIAATNRNLKQLVAEGRFRGDLYYRLFVVPIPVPALRERREDIPLLARHFLNACSARWGKHFDGIDSKTLERMRRYSWPGNVRELEHAIERGALISDGPRLHVEQLEEGIPSALACDSRASSSGTLEDVQRDHIQRTLESTDYRISGPGGAAERLAIHPNTLRYRMSRLGIRTR